ncbi:uncharacterized protein CIMG_04933 [Coccidioides immitis RS]|uniref:Uncharacterized protein n=1 Tax=Coccidioides immitis (strain RS) TaxID=246410 RepID=J3KEI7_COCIM|nr:uncharacterized protein CIMG_04933 [Coccidioides immitis RS]EAS33909.3 hypothetical protein CIMG_04933 [Coccidioides immitis RS]
MLPSVGGYQCAREEMYSVVGVNEWPDERIVRMSKKAYTRLNLPSTPISPHTARSTGTLKSFAFVIMVCDPAWNGYRGLKLQMGFHAVVQPLRDIKACVKCLLKCRLQPPKTVRLAHREPKRPPMFTPHSVRSKNLKLESYEVWSTDATYLFSTPGALSACELQNGPGWGHKQVFVLML